MSNSVFSDHRPLIMDTTALLFIPTVLVLLHFSLPTELHDRLVFTYGDPSAVAAWSSAYLHNTDTHLYSNLAGYALSITFGYSLYYTNLQKRRQFWLTVGAVMAVTPFITTTVDYVVLYQYAELLPSDANSQGFSGIVSAFGGMFLTAIGLTVANAYDAMTGIHTVLLIFLVALGVLTVANVIITPMMAGLLIFGIGLLSTQFVSLTDLQNPTRLRTRVEEHAASIIQLALYTIVVCLFVYVMLPIEVVQAGNFVNILAHTTGFIIGMLGAASVAYFAK